MIGLFAMMANHASYSDNFSSVFRFARGSHVSEMIKDDDKIGSDPLPEYLSAATVKFNGPKDLRREGDHEAAYDDSSMPNVSASFSQDQPRPLRNHTTATARYQHLEQSEHHAA